MNCIYVLLPQMRSSFFRVAYLILVVSYSDSSQLSEMNVQIEQGDRSPWIFRIKAPQTIANVL